MYYLFLLLLACLGAGVGITLSLLGELIWRSVMGE